MSLGICKSKTRVAAGEGVLETRQLRKAVSVEEIKRKKRKTRADFFLLSQGWGSKQSGCLQQEKNPRSRLAMRILELCPLHLDALPFCLNEGYLKNILKRAQNFEGFTE